MAATHLVTGATGQQGRATINALLARGARLHAVVRDPTKTAARELQARGVVLFKGDNDDFEVFHKAAQGCAGVFLNVMERPQNREPHKQVEGILAACRDAGVQHVIVSTSSWAGNREKWDIPETKKGTIFAFNEGEELVEDAVRQSGLRYTILQPSLFHSNYLPLTIDHFYLELRASGILVHSLEPGATLPHINVKDIGEFAAMALSDPDGFNGQEIELTSENLGIEGVAEAISKATGRHLTVKKATTEEPGKPSQITQWHVWANSADLKVDTESLKQRYDFRFTTLAEYLMQEREQGNLEYFQ
ncbi:NmrA family protein [Xylaria arbuscula]|nr:NmrA family protein [Xylaria arbuscula]